MAHKWCPDNPDDIARRYVAGESEKALAESLGVSRDALRRVLQDAGVPRRGRSDAMYLRMSRTSAEDRARLASAAHDAVRGKVRDREIVERAARTRERNQSHTSPAEHSLAAMLRSRGVSGVVLQKAIGPYNADLAAGSVAVEILGGNWHRSKRHGKRLRYLLEGGWDVVFVWVDGIHAPLGAGAADYIAAHLKFRQAHPAARRCYRVIRGTGQFLAGAEFDGDDIPDVLPNSDRPDVPPAVVEPGFCQCGCGEKTRISRQSDPAKGWIKGQPRRFLSGHNNSSRSH